MIDEDGYHELMRKIKSPPPDTAIKMHNQSFLEDKQLSENIKDAQWVNYGSRLGNVITESVNASALNAPPMALSQPLVAPQGDPGDDFVGILEKDLGKKYFNKGMRFYSLLTSVDGVSIAKDGITVDGQNIRGSFSKIISNLVRNNNLMAYPSKVLLEKIVQSGFGTLLRSLIDNKEAKQYVLKLLEFGNYTGSPLSGTLTPVSASTPFTLPKSKSKSKSKSYADTPRYQLDFADASVDQSGDNTVVENPMNEYYDTYKKKGSNQNVRWISLFSKNGKRKQPRKGVKRKK